MMELLLALAFAVPPPEAPQPATSAQLVQMVRESGDSCDYTQPPVAMCWLGVNRVCISFEVWPADGWGPPECRTQCFVFLSERCGE